MGAEKSSSSSINGAVGGCVVGWCGGHVRCGSELVLRIREREDAWTLTLGMYIEIVSHSTLVYAPIDCSSSLSLFSFQLGLMRWKQCIRVFFEDVVVVCYEYQSCLFQSCCFVEWHAGRENEGAEMSAMTEAPSAGP